MENLVSKDYKALSQAYIFFIKIYFLVTFRRLQLKRSYLAKTFGKVVSQRVKILVA